MRYGKIIFLLLVCSNAFGQGLIPKPLSAEISNDFLDLKNSRMVYGYSENLGQHPLLDYLFQEVVQPYWGAIRDKKLVMIHLFKHILESRLGFMHYNNMILF